MQATYLCKFTWIFEKILLDKGCAEIVGKYEQFEICTHCL